MEPDVANLDARVFTDSSTVSPRQLHIKRIRIFSAPFTVVFPLSRSSSPSIR